jgi:hypothetical protein
VGESKRFPDSASAECVDAIAGDWSHDEDDVGFWSGDVLLHLDLRHI